MRGIYCYFLILSFFSGLVAHADRAEELGSRPTDWQSIFSDGAAARVRFGSEIDGPSPYSLRSNELFLPASVSKLITVGAAFKFLGAEYKFPTVLEWTLVAPGTAANVRLLGNGDPSWGLEELNEAAGNRIEQIADKFVAMGITKISGSIYVGGADTRWGNNQPAGRESSDDYSCYGAPAQAFNINLNCSTLVVSSPNSASWMDLGVATPVSLNLRYAKTNNISLVKRGDGYFVSGTIRKGAKFSYRIPVLGTSGWVKNLFIRALKARGVTSEVSPVEATGQRQQIISLSAPLSIIVKPFLKNSINVVGEAIFKNMGTNDRKIADLNLAGAEVLDRYGDLIQLPKEMSLHDGSGLTRNSRVTPKGMLKLLDALKEDPNFKFIWDALPVAGVDGTLKNRMKGTSAEGALRAKTGSLSGVYNLAGYVPDGRDFVPFVVLAHSARSDSSVARGTQDKIGARLAALVGAPQSFEMPFLFMPEHAGLDNQ